MNRLAAALFASFVSVACSLASASACSFLELPLVVDPEEERIDHAPPARPEVQEVSVHRGQGPRSLGGGMSSSTSCDDIGSLSFILAVPHDDRTPPEKIGVEMRVVRGKLPEGFRLPEKPLLGRRDGDRYRFGLHWIDGATDDQDAIDVTVGLVAVDQAGNRSEVSAPIKVTNP